MATTMEALVYHGPGMLFVEERPIPSPAAGEVLIEVKAASICGSDLGAYRHASDRFMPPLVLGHEFAGTVAAVGGDVRDVRAGQRVSVNPMLYCNDCFHCRRGEFNLCGNRKSLGTAIGGTRTDGAMRQYMTIRSSAVVPLADGVSFRDGAMLEPMAVSLACAKCERGEDEENVVVLGMGPIGLMIVKFLKTLGTPNVVAVDIIDKRLAKARECGADHAINGKAEDAVSVVRELTRDVGADRVVIAAGVASSIADAFAMVRNGGTAVLVALMHETVAIDPMQIVGRGIKLVGSYMFTDEMAEAANLLAAGKIAVLDLATSAFPLRDGKHAFDLLSDPDNDEIKVQLTMGE